MFTYWGRHLIKIDWNSLFLWPGYDFWGVVLGVIGSVASVIFAMLASKNAKKAAEAAAQAKKSMVVVDHAAQLTSIQQYIVELRLRLENEQWEQVSEQCDRIRTTLAPVMVSNGFSLSKETHKSLVGLQSQMASMQKTADEIRHKQKQYDLVKIKTVLAKQSEVVARAVGEVRQMMEITDV